MGKKLQKIYLIFYSLLIAQDLWQAHYGKLINNLSEGRHRIKCKLGHNDKKCETCGIKFKYCNFFLEYANSKDGLIEFKCLVCNKDCQTV